MIYLVTQQILPESDKYKIISIEESLSKLNPLEVVGLDTETSGVNHHKDTLLSLQLGCKEFQVVIDCTTVSPLFYKEYLESDRLFLGHNIKFDLCWLYLYHIVPKRVYDSMIAEQLLWLGYPITLTPEQFYLINCDRYVRETSIDKGKEKVYYILRKDLKTLGERYLGIELDKSVRGKINYAGITNEDVIVYAAEDVAHLEDLMEAQKVELEKENLLKAVDLECRAILPISYMEFCGVKIDKEKWLRKVEAGEKKEKEAKKILDDWLIQNMPDSKYVVIDRQGDLFEGFNLEPQTTINWNSIKQVIPIFKAFGVDTTKIDKESKEESDGVNAKILKPQAHICSLIEPYLRYKEIRKDNTTYGRNVLDQIDGKTGRLYTKFNIIGTDTSRISSGGKDKANKIKYINFLNFPADEITRSCFVAEKGNRWISIDYSGQESVIIANTAKDEAMIEEFNHGSGDIHSVVAKFVFPNELKDVPVTKVKEVSNESKHNGGVNYRSVAKGYEFLVFYGGTANTIQTTYGKSEKEANEIYNNISKGLKGVIAYQNYCRKDVMEKGYIVMNTQFGHRAHIYDWANLSRIKNKFNQEFWAYYREMKEAYPTCDTVQEVRHYFRRKSDSEKHSINYRIQNKGAMCSKIALVNFFEWLRREDLLFKVLITIAPYDEGNFEAPEEIAELVAEKIRFYMVESGKLFCKYCKLDADISRLENGELPNYWVH